MTASVIQRTREACSEAAAWHARPNATADGRSEVLRPSLSDHPPYDELRDAVEILVQRRRDLLAGAAQPDTARGRVLICEFNMSFVSGESQLASGGFFDLDDRPPWDLWLSVVESSSGDPILLAWVPEGLVESVAAGIAANPYGCIYWLSDAPADLNRIPLMRDLLRDEVRSRTDT